MSTVIESGKNTGGGFEPHPEGTFMAVLADVFTMERPNKYYGQVNARGQADNREVITKVCLAFLTTEMVEIDGVMKPRYASFWSNATFGTDDYPSNLRKFIKAWQPTIKDFSRVDLDQLIGRGAYLTITHSVDKGGKTWANVTGAMTPPPASPIPNIPADFVRHKDKEAQPVAAQPERKGPEPIGKDDDNDLPF